MLTLLHRLSYCQYWQHLHQIIVPSRTLAYDLDPYCNLRTASDKIIINISLRQNFCLHVLWSYAYKLENRNRRPLTAVLLEDYGGRTLATLKDSMINVVL